MNVLIKMLAVAVSVFACASELWADGEWPTFPTKNADVEIPAQAWPIVPGPRRVKIQIRYPGGSIESLTAKSGIMLSLHNWGGVDSVGTANPETLAREFDVVAICVNYLQSGPKASIQDPEPYDCGYLQALDALRAVWYVQHNLREQARPFDSGRIFATGGSGGGNVSLMANKLAPRTFACIVDMCGMKKLTHDVAFQLPGGSDLNARWNRDPSHPFYLSPDAQDIRFVAHPEHLATMKRLGNTARVIVVHGVDDQTCPYEDAVELVEAMRRANLNVEPRYVTKDVLDGQVFTGTAHSLGDRTRIVQRVGAAFLKPDSATAARRTEPNDFDRRDESVQYDTRRGTFVISYAQGYPVGRFEPKSVPPHYVEHADLSYFLDANGARQPIRSPEEWTVRRQHILRHFQRAAGDLPSECSRVPLKLTVAAESKVGPILRKKITYQSDPLDRVSAWLLIPERKSNDRLPAMLCLHQTFAQGKDEPVGLAGSPNLHYALELAERGFVTLAPDYPSFGEHPFDFAANPEYASGTIKAVWDNIRAVDLLAGLDDVDPNRIGVIGHSLGGHNAIFTALFEPRLRVIVSSCGFSSLVKDDIPSWTGPRYMPRIAKEFQNNVAHVPFDFTELIGALAPRAFLASAATKDDDFDVSGVRDVIEAAQKVYDRHGAGKKLQAIYPESPHDFPLEARQRAYAFIRANL